MADFKQLAAQYKAELLDKVIPFWLEKSQAGRGEGPTPGGREWRKRQLWARMRGRPGVNQLRP